MGAKGNKIVISANPRGRFIEGYITGTPKPGIMVQIDVSEAREGGRLTYEPYNQSVDAQMGLVMILLEDKGQGKNNSTAYATGERAFFYMPLPGDELNVLVQDVAGTADDFAVGDRLIVDDTTGKFLTTTGTAADKAEHYTHSLRLDLRGSRSNRVE